MKLKYFAALLFTTYSCLLFSQEKRIDFVKKLRYELVSNKTNKIGKAPVMSFENYISKNNEFLTTGDLKNFKINLFNNKETSTPVNIGFNNRLTANNLFLQMWNIDEDEINVQKFAASKLDVSETIAGLPCNQYVLKPVFVDENSEEKDKDNLKICINETKNINNMPVMSSIFNTMRNDRKVEFNLSGLILKVGPEKNYDEEHLILKSIEDNNDFVLFDYKKAMADQKQALDSIKEERKKWEKLYESDSAVAAVDSAAASYFEQIPEYKSTYKIEPKRDTMNLAVNNDYSKDFLKGIPKHCTTIEKDIPAFEMKDLDYHVKNYVGQMCDMYLTQSRDHSVAVKITLDEIRREALFLMNIRQKLSEKDRKKLDKYLNNLD